MTLPQLKKLAWVTLAFNLLVIVWGAYVRASGSGAGCGSHWPLCNGEVVPLSPNLETVIEYSHRLTSGIALILVTWLFFAARGLPRGHRIRRATWWSLIFILLEAALGAGLVKFGLVADNDSLLRAVVMAAHLCNTFILVGALALTVFYSSDPRYRPDRSAPGRWWEISLVVGTLVVGIAGAIAALGDTLFPATSLIEGLSQDFSPTAHFLLKLRTLHPFLACAVGGLIVVYASRRENSRYANALKWMTYFQLGFGGLNLVLLAPVWAQLVHLLLADLLWILLIVAIAEHRLPSRPLDS